MWDVTYIGYIRNQIQQRYFPKQEISVKPTEISFISTLQTVSGSQYSFYTPG